MVGKNKLIVTTSWDDGTSTDIRLAELLAKYQLRGTFYLPQTNPESLLSKQDILDIDRNFEIGAHSVSQPFLTKIPLSIATQEIVQSKEYLEAIIGHPVAMFGYPCGNYNDSIKAIVKDAGFVAARTSRYGGFSYPQDPYAWPITMLANNYSPLLAARACRDKKLNLRAWYDWEARAVQLFAKARQTGGVFHIYGHSLEIENKLQWGKLENVFRCISGSPEALYMTNGEIFKAGLPS